MSQFKFELTERVMIKVSSEIGTVIGRAQFIRTDHTYLLEYKAADGKAAEAWFAAAALTNDIIEPVLIQGMLCSKDPVLVVVYDDHRVHKGTAEFMEFGVKDGETMAIIRWPFGKVEFVNVYKIEFVA